MKVAIKRNAGVLKFLCSCFFFPSLGWAMDPSALEIKFKEAKALVTEKLSFYYEVDVKFRSEQLEDYQKADFLLQEILCYPEALHLSNPATPDPLSKETRYGTLKFYEQFYGKCALRFEDMGINRCEFLSWYKEFAPMRLFLMQVLYDVLSCMHDPSRSSGFIDPLQKMMEFFSASVLDPIAPVEAKAALTALFKSFLDSHQEMLCQDRATFLHVTGVLVTQFLLLTSKCYACFFVEQTASACQTRFSKDVGQFLHSGLFDYGFGLQLLGFFCKGVPKSMHTLFCHMDLAVFGEKPLFTSPGCIGSLWWQGYRQHLLIAAERFLLMAKGLQGIPGEGLEEKQKDAEFCHALSLFLTKSVNAIPEPQEMIHLGFGSLQKEDVLFDTSVVKKPDIHVPQLQLPTGIQMFINQFFWKVQLFVLSGFMKAYQKQYKAFDAQVLGFLKDKAPADFVSSIVSLDVCAGALTAAEKYKKMTQYQNLFLESCVGFVTGNKKTFISEVLHASEWPLCFQHLFSTNQSKVLEKPDSKVYSDSNNMCGDSPSIQESVLEKISRLRID